MCCQRGTWKYMSEWQQDSREEEITVIPKHLWPVEHSLELIGGLEMLSREAFIEEASQRCTMIWEETMGKSQFIVPSTWGE